MILAYIRNHKKQSFMICFIIIVFLAIIIIMNNNYSFYQTTIATVTNVSEEFLKTEKGKNKEEEKYYIQNIDLEIRNGELKGNIVSLQNIFSYSRINSDRYKINDDVFVQLEEKPEGLLATINGLKRDKYVVFLIMLLIIGLIAIAGRQGVYTIISLTVNIGVYIVAINKYVHGKNFVNVSIMMVITFSVLTLIILGGINRKTIGAIISTLITILAAHYIYSLVIKYIESPPYELMDYMVGPDDLKEIFMAGIVIGCIGAIMDVAITMNSAINELVKITDSITIKQLIGSIREIGYDIMGTMINVILFTYISGSFPIIILKIKNGYTLYSLINYSIVFELTRFLVGAIGIVLAIPISGLIAVLLVKKGRIKENVISS